MFTKRHVTIGILLIFVQLACSVGGFTISPAADQAPAEGEAPQKNAQATSMPLIPQGGSTAVNVIPPTPEVNIQVPQPQSGTGSVAGRILWNSQPVVGTEVKMCEKMAMFSGCEGKQFSAVTDTNGVYLLANITPGEYAVIVHSIDSDTWQYVSSGIIKARKFQVEPDKTAVLEDQHLFKYDLKLISPADKTKVSEAKPTLKWEPYVDAGYYQVYFTPDGAKSPIINHEHFTTTEVTSPVELLACDYTWKVEVFNTQGVKIAENNSYSDFTVIDQPISCYITIKSPADQAQLASNAVTLSWDAHPLAVYYKVVVWKKEVAGEAVLDYARVDGTSFKFTQTLATDKYYWSVGAFNSSDGRIADSPLYVFFVK